MLPLIFAKRVFLFNHSLHENENSEFAPKMVCIFYKIGSEIGLNFTNISRNTKVGALIGTPEGVGEN